nr:3-hydroxyacyl-ACP dehydratase [uncultured Flavobacterium sp.]
MLFPTFYKVTNTQQIDDFKYKFEISLNPNHEIFKGHFPNNPVTPGVCMMQIIKELTQDICEVNLQLIQSNNIKFMALINPEINPDLVLELDITKSETEVKVKNTTFFGETTALKLSSVYQIKK